MFTGIIAALGRITSIETHADSTFGIDIGALDSTRLHVGDSVSVQGVCLTAVRLEGNIFYADVSRETLRATSLGRLEVGGAVNLEPALRAGDALGGHLVSGHIDATAALISATQDARSWRMQFELPAALARFVAPKGSICLDGVSLTVNGVDGPRFDVNIIPHTYSATTLGSLRSADRVNVEIDVIARYLDRLIDKAH